MPRFFFDTFDGERVVSDADGIEFDGLAGVREAAINALPSIARDRLPDGEEMEMWVKVRDSSDCPIFEASLKFSSRWTTRDES